MSSLLSPRVLSSALLFTASLFEKSDNVMKASMCEATCEDFQQIKMTVLQLKQKVPATSHRPHSRVKETGGVGGFGGGEHNRHGCLFFKPGF